MRVRGWLIGRVGEGGVNWWGERGRWSGFLLG